MIRDSFLCWLVSPIPPVPTPTLSVVLFCSYGTNLIPLGLLEFFLKILISPGGGGGGGGAANDRSL